MNIHRHITGLVHSCYWQDDINCARTMLTVLSALGGPAVQPAVMQAAVGMHGAGGYGAQCGLVEGGLMFIGLAGAARGLSEEAITAACREYATGFAAAFGSLVCRQLRPEGFGHHNPPHLCEQLTVRAALFAAGFMRDQGFISY